MRKPYTLGLTGILLMCALASPAAAAEPTPRGTGAADPAKMVIIGDDGGEMTLELGNGQLTMIAQEDGHTSTRIVDLEALGLLAADAVDGAVVGIEEIFSQLQEMQFQFRLGQDNRLNLKCADSEFELDLDQVMAQVASAVQLGLQEINTADWTERRGRWDTVPDDELRTELEALKGEMEELRHELRRLQQEKQKQKR